MPGRTVTTWGKTWKSGETRVIRVPAGLADELLRLAHAIEDGAQIKVIPQPELFDEKPKRKLRVIVKVPQVSKSNLTKPVTAKKKPRVSLGNS